MNSRTKPSRDVSRILQERVLVEQALQKAARQAVREHKKEGLPLAMWRDGQVVWMSAEDVEAELGEPA